MKSSRNAWTEINANISLQCSLSLLDQKQSESPKHFAIAAAKLHCSLNLVSLVYFTFTTIFTHIQ